jgi:hypothetical protein
MMTAPTIGKRTSAPVELDLDARLAMVGAIMTGRLDEAAVAFEVNTAHIPATPIPEITAPLPLTPTAAPCPYSTPIAATLHRARLRLETGGWCTGQLRDEQGAACLIGLIRAEAPTRGAADDACVVLLDAIRRDFAHVETIPSWNDAQRDPRLPAVYLDRAAALAHARLI